MYGTLKDWREISPNLWMCKLNIHTAGKKSLSAIVISFLISFATSDFPRGTLISNSFSEDMLFF